MTKNQYAPREDIYRRQARCAIHISQVIEDYTLKSDIDVNYSELIRYCVRKFSVSIKFINEYVQTYINEKKICIVGGFLAREIGFPHTPIQESDVTNGEQ